MTALAGEHEEIIPEPNYLGNIETWRKVMHSTVRMDSPCNLRGSDHRAAPRATVTLPIFIVLNGKKHNAILRNLSRGGAMIVTSAPMVLHTKVEFHCGMICAPGVVVWQRRTGSGIRFENKLSEIQLQEQVSRLNAVYR